MCNTCVFWMSLMHVLSNELTINRNFSICFSLLFSSQGTEAIEGLALKLHSNKRYCFKADAFAEMKRLRLLQLDNVELTGDYRYLSKQLRWISWKGFSLKYIPKSFYLEGAIAIDLKHSSLRLVWKEPQVYITHHFLLKIIV